MFTPNFWVGGIIFTAALVVLFLIYKFVVHSKWLKENPEKLDKFIGGTKTGLNMLKDVLELFDKDPSRDNFIEKLTKRSLITVIGIEKMKDDLVKMSDMTKEEVISYIKTTSRKNITDQLAMMGVSTDKVSDETKDTIINFGISLAEAMGIFNNGERANPEMAAVLLGEDETSRKLAVENTKRKKEVTNISNEINKKLEDLEKQTGTSDEVVESYKKAFRDLDIQVRKQTKNG